MINHAGLPLAYQQAPITNKAISDTGILKHVSEADINTTAYTYSVQDVARPGGRRPCGMV